jgi:hypothetical protein
MMLLTPGVENDVVSFMAKDILGVTEALKDALLIAFDAAPRIRIGRSKLDAVSAEPLIFEILDRRVGMCWVNPRQAIDYEEYVSDFQSWLLSSSNSPLVSTHLHWFFTDGGSLMYGADRSFLTPLAYVEISMSAPA